MTLKPQFAAASVAFLILGSDAANAGKTVDEAGGLV
jgi:hypothetical protein